MLLRREPFRLLFPVGLLLGTLGVGAWIAFGLAWIGWPGQWHALTMTQGFIVTVAAGFLGTMIPRRTGAAPFGRLELSSLIAGLLGGVAAIAAGSLAIGEGLELLALASLGLFLARRFRAARRPIAPSFVLLPVALAACAAGSAMLVAAGLGVAGTLYAPGRALVEQGLLLPLVLAIVPMLTPIIVRDRTPPTTTAPARRRGMLLYGAVGAAIEASLFLPPRAGLAVRGILVSATLIGAGALGWPTAPGLHRRLYSLSLWFVPVGLLAAAAIPAWMLAFLHLTFIGGISLLVFAVATHVTALHTGHDPIARGRPPAVALAGGLVIAAALLRASAQALWKWYPQMLVIAAGLWIAGAAAWLYFCAPLLRHRSPDEASA